MTTGRNTHRIAAGVVLTLVLGTGALLTGCSSDSETDAETSGNANGTASTSASQTEGKSDAKSDAKGGDEETEASSEPIDFATAILGADDAPEGYSWMDVSGQGTADAETLQQLSQVLDQMTFSPASCKTQMRALLDPAAAAGQGSASSAFTSDADPEGSALVVTIGPKSTGDPHACDNATATGKTGDADMKLTMSSTDLGVSIKGAKSVSALRTTTTVTVGGQSQSNSQSTIAGEVDGTWFSISAQGNVDQGTLVSLAQKQADRLQR